MMFPKLPARKKPRLARRQFTIRGVPVDYAAMHSYIVRRDGTCLAFRMDIAHVCRGRDGRIHSPDNAAKLTLDHVPERGRNALGKKADSDEYHLVALCHRLNGGGGSPSHDLRDFERDWIADHETERAV
jgi:hypothetical protein